MAKQWQPTKFDLGLSTVVAIFLPFLAKFLYDRVGAMVPMQIYYITAWGIFTWRRGTSGYFNKFGKKIPRIFLVNVGVILLSLAFAYYARIVDLNPDTQGVLKTALIWAPVNAASEQLLWIYIFEAWDLYLPQREENRKKRWIYRIIGLILFSSFVGTIHTMFWVNFLHTVSSESIIGVLFILATTVSGYLHLVVWRKSNQMIYTFIPHFMLNLIPLFWTGYSIVPYLWK